MAMGAEGGDKPGQAQNAFAAVSSVSMACRAPLTQALQPQPPPVHRQGSAMSFSDFLTRPFLARLKIPTERGNQFFFLTWRQQGSHCTCPLCCSVLRLPARQQPDARRSKRTSAMTGLGRWVHMHEAVPCSGRGA